MDAKTSNFFLLLWLFSIVIWTSPSYVDATEILSIEKLENMLKIDSQDSEANWPKSTGNDDSPFYVMIFRKGENEVKFAPKLISNHTDDKPVKFSFQYWGGDEEYRFIDPNDSTKTIKLNGEKKFKDATVPKPLTIGDLKTMYLTPAFLTEEHRLFLRNVDISDFINYYDPKNFEENPPDKKYTLKKDANKIAVLQKVYNKDDFDKVCIKMNLPAKSELYLSLDGDTHIMQLPFEVFNAIQDDVCLRDILAMKPGGPFMLMVRTMTDQTGDYYVEFSNTATQELSPTKPDTKVEKGWIYYYPNSDYYDLELKAPKENAKFFACDSMANCFDYKTSDNKTFKLDEDQKNKLKDSVIISRFASNVRNEDYNGGKSFEEKTISWLKDRIKVEGSKTPEIDSSKSLKLTIEPKIPNSPITLTIPYIDLRVFSPKVKIDSPASVGTISIFKSTNKQMKIEHEKIEQFFEEAKIELSEFLKPDIKDFNDFNDFKYEFKINSQAQFEITITLDSPNDNRVPVVKKCIPKAQATTSCLFRSKWVMAPYKEELRDFGSNTFKFEKPDSKGNQIEFKRQIISYDGKLLSEKSPKSTVNNQQTFGDNVKEEVEGPIKVLYWINYPSKYGDLTATIDLQDQTLTSTIDGPVSKIYDPAYYEKSDQTCPKGFEWVESLKRCMLSDKSHPSLNENCDNAFGCTNIFDKHLMKMSVYINDATKKLEIDGEQDFNGLEIKEMYTPTTKKNRIVLKKHSSMLKDTDDPEDFCIKFKHFGYKIQLLAGVESMPGYDFQFNHDLLSMTDGLFTRDSICASQLLPPPSDTIVLSFVDPDQNSELLQKSVGDLTLDTGHPINQPIDGLMQKEFTDQEFFMESKDKDFIKVEPGIIKFSFKKDQANKATNQESFQRILTTKFLKMPINNQIANKNKNMKINIGLKYSGDFLDYGGNVWIQFRPQSKSPYNIKNWELQAMNHLNYEPINQNLTVELLQVQFVFEIKNIAKMKELLEQKNQEEVDFLIEELSINDLCVGETNSLTDFCSGLKNACKRNFTTRAHYCECPQYHSGEECENFDFCDGENRTKFCQQHSFGACENDFKRKSWHCTCNHEQTWIPIEEKCLTKIGLDCKGGQIIEVNNDRPQCVCPDGQVDIGGVEAPNCVEYDICNQVHRKAKGEPEEPCDDVNAECKKNSSSDYQCVCKNDMMNDEGEFGPKAYCLDRLCELNLKCQQKCSLATVGKTECLCYKNYNRIPNKDNDHNCQIKPDLREKENNCLPPFDIDQLSIFERAYLKDDNTCGCKLEGYDFDDALKKCIPNDNNPVKTQLKCERVIKFPNGTTKFVGPEGKQFDHVYGKCDYPKCSQSDQIVFVEDKYNSECLSVCETSIFKGCTDNFSRCNSIKVMEQIRKIVTSKTENGIPIIFKEKYDILNDTTLCDCIDGFKKKAGDQCVIDPERKMFEIGVEFNQAINGKTTIENYFEQILKYFFKERKDKPTIDEKENIKVACDVHDNKCTAFIAVTPASALEPQNIVDYLKNHCFDESLWKKNSETSKNCYFILPRNDDNKDVVFVLSRVKDGNITSNFNRCFSKPCENFKHRSCRMRDQNPFEFSCDCDGFYKNSKQKILDLPETYQCEMKTCEENNIHCKDLTAKCEMFEPRVGYGINVPMFEQTNIAKWYFGSFGAFRDEPFPLCFCPNGKVVADINELCSK